MQHAVENRSTRSGSLRRRLTLHAGLMIVSVLLLGGAAIVGVDGLHQDLGVALQGYRELKQVYDVGVHIAAAGQAVREPMPSAPRALAAARSAAMQLEAAPFNGQADATSAPPHWLNEVDRDNCKLKISNAIARLREWNAAPEDPTALAAARESLAAVVDELTAITVNARRTISARQEAADTKHTVTLYVVASISLMVLAGAIVLAWRQYRSVVRPLETLGDGVRQFSGGDLQTRVTLSGDREFAALAADFNRMAQELESFYRELEQKVSDKSRELVRSQRLASVGFLAAGVAHEINNPLGIITGYGERALHLLSRSDDVTALPQTQRALQIICEEAFRCKEITQRLLSLSRPGAEGFGPVPLSDLAETVISNLGGLPEFADRQIILEKSEGDRFTVTGGEGELKQILLNLALNALEAVGAGGRVTISLARASRQSVELIVCDNGRGMSRETLERAFEPFYSENRGRRPEAELRRGTGLGLSITHAIVIDHHGTLTAHSDGPGTGSRFVVSLPAVVEDKAVIDA